MQAKVFQAVWYPSPPIDNIRVMVIVWRLRGNIIRNLCVGLCDTMFTVHSTFMWAVLTGPTDCKNRPRNYLLCVEWDVKPTHSLRQCEHDVKSYCNALWCNSLWQWCVWTRNISNFSPYWYVLGYKSSSLNKVSLKKYQKLDATPKMFHRVWWSCRLYCCA